MKKVLFLYKDYAYNYSIISTVKELQKYDIQLECHQMQDAEQAKRHLKLCDLLLLNPRFFDEEFKSTKNCVAPIALVSDVDGAWCSPHIHLLPYVKGFIESYSYIPRTLHNLPYYCYNMELLSRIGCRRRTDVSNAYNIPELSEEELKKIHVYCGFGSWERMKDIGNNENIDLKAPRSNPIFFAGTVEYAGTEIEDNRIAAVEVCNKVGGVGVAGRLVQWPEYRATFLNSKAILSPWAWGEACHRDFEALAFGCILIKPDWSFVESFPDISSHSAPYIPCQLDFADVPDIINNICNNWDSYLDLRIKGLRLAKIALDIPSNTKRLVKIFKCLLNQK